jgi:deazaflavin-dependent oxidoreductase (nitroreductase family)
MLVGRLASNVDDVLLLVVPGRRSGRPRVTPLKVLHAGGERYLVSRYSGSDWVLNLRASPEAELRLGARRERVYAVPLAGDQAAPVLREYVRQASLRSTAALLGVESADATESEYVRSAATHQVFRLHRR